MSGLLSGKHVLIVGIANEQSIAFGVAQAMRQAGADIAVTYLNAKAERFVRPLAEIPWCLDHRSAGRGASRPGRGALRPHRQGVGQARHRRAFHRLCSAR